MKFTLPISLLLKCVMGHCKILMLVKEHEYRYNVFSCTILDKKNILKILKKVLFLRILIGFREISNTV